MKKVLLISILVFGIAVYAAPRAFADATIPPLLAPLTPSSAPSSGCEPGSTGYCMLAPIPHISDSSGHADISTYINNMFQILTGLAAALAVLRLIYAGIQYMSTEAITGKSNAKGVIQDALLGLLLAISSYTILHTINPKLTTLTLTIQGEQVGGAFDLNTGVTVVPTGSGQTASGCSNCTPPSSKIPQKGVAPEGSTNGACKYPGPCVVSPALSRELTLINQAMGIRAWTVTEMFPPTVYHIDSCHSNGTCVDATVADRSVSGLITFFKAIEKSGASSYEYEICDSTRLSALQKDPAFSGLKVSFKCETSTTGESVHINM